LLVTPKRIRLPSDERRRLLVDAAFSLLAQGGFEGFRTRDVADAARINSATLHHYSPTKEDLITAVAERLAARFESERAPAATTSDAIGELRQQFRDIEYYARSRPELIAVYRELVARGHRDAGTRELVQRLNRGWQKSVELIVARGKTAGVFRADCEPAAAASAIVAACWGFITLLDVTPATFKRGYLELERGLLAPNRRKKGASA
jgi:AcrR family transcriptional regulator